MFNFFRKISRHFILGSFISSITISIMYLLFQHNTEYVTLLLNSSIFSVILVFGLFLSIELYSKFVYTVEHISKVDVRVIDWKNIIFATIGAVISCVPIIVIFLLN